MKRELWDGEYARGVWDHCGETPTASVYPFVELYCERGSILDLGCGFGNTGNEIQSTHYRDYTGVDISAVAVQRALLRSSANGRGQNSYVQADILSYVPLKKYDVILFRESIYYVPDFRLKAVLKRYSRFLTERGAFVVHVSSRGTKAHKRNKILLTIEQNFKVLKKNVSKGFTEYIVVFRSWVTPLGVASAEYFSGAARNCLF